MSRDDDRSWNDGDKLSFSERDRLRREGGRRERRPRGVSAARTEAATRDYVKSLEGLFAKTKGGPEVEKLAAAVRDSHGSPELADHCRAYVQTAGFPDEPALLGMFLDTGDSELMVGGLQAIGALCDGGKLKISGGLRSQLRMLADAPDAEVAELAEAILGR